ELAAGPTRLLLEVGPGRTLGALARRHSRSAEVFSPLAGEGAGEQAREQEAMLAALGGLWSAGARVDWRGFQREERRRGGAVPAHSFGGGRYLIGGGNGNK